MKVVAIVGTFSPLSLEKLKEKLSINFHCIHLNNTLDFEKLSEANYVVLRGPKMYADVLDKLTGNLKLIQRWGTGYDGIDIKRAGELGISVGITRGINANAVSELVIALILALYRHIVPLHNRLISGIWDRQLYIEKTYEIKNKTVGIVGFGNIGRLVSEKLQGFGAKVIYYDIYRLSPETEKELNVKFASLTDLFSSSDIVSLHVPSTQETIGMVNKEIFSIMKPNAVLINTARGNIINEEDLYIALKSHQILGAGLDTFSQEPLSADSPLLSLDNIILLPHVGGNTVDMNSAMVERVVENILRIDNNEQLHNGDLVNGEYLTNNK
jgi:phosphoglycerate dehydrogenase-like enzyme